MRSILIDSAKTAPKSCAFSFPWKHDSICYNFRMPNESMTYAELGRLERTDNIETLAIGDNLEDYGFISGFAGLKQLYIYDGDGVHDIEFVKDLIHLQQLCLIGTHIDSLDPLVELLQKKKQRIRVEENPWEKIMLHIEGICIETDCELVDVKAVMEYERCITEMIINGIRIIK